MTVKTKPAFPVGITQKNMQERLPALLFFLIIALNTLTTYHATGSFIDSDASSELVLAHQLSQTGQILSRDWIYSTELRVLNTQLIYAPMFLIFSDWHLVRFSSALILQAIYIGTYGFMLNQGGFSKRQFYMSAALLLLPVSVAYGRIVLYHCYYIPHISLSFLLVGLFLGFSEKTALSPVRSCVRLGFLLFFSFLGGLGGIRQLMITHAPMLLLLLLLCFLEDLQSNDCRKAALFSRQKILLFAVAFLGLLAAFIGYKVNTTIFPKYYTFTSYNETTLDIPDADVINRLIYGFLHQFGFRKYTAMLSLLGILSLGSIPAAGFCLYLSFRNIRSYPSGQDLRKTMVQLFYLGYWIVMTAVFLLTDGGYHYVLYYVICLPWAVPLLISIPTHIPRTIHPFNVKRIFSWVTVCILFANGFANTAFFNGVEKFDQIYEGLKFQNKDKAAQMAELADYLTENGYDAGYATFWEGNILTEISDGKLPMTNLDLIEIDGGADLQYYQWLTSQWQQEAVKEKPFFVTRTNYQHLFEVSDAFQYCTLIYADDFHCAYSIDHLQEFIDTL